jgi:MFS family permease
MVRPSSSIPLREMTGARKSGPVRVSIPSQAPLVIGHSHCLALYCTFHALSPRFVLELLPLGFHSWFTQVFGTQTPYQPVREGSESPPNMESSDKTPDEHMPIEIDPEPDGLALFERKAEIVNRELDSMGMGRYQWMVFSLCGFGYMLDLLWAQAFGLVVAPLKQELGFSDPEVGNISSAFAAGLTAGAFVWGVLVDIIGRQWAFNFTVLISSTFGLCLGAPSDYNTILVLTAFVGFGVGGNIPIDTTIMLEFLPQNRRFLLPLLSVFQPIGVVVCSALAYAFIPRYSCATNLKSCHTVPAGQECCTKANNYGWRYLLFTLGAITMLVFFLRFVVFRFQESPKYLLYRGMDQKAVKVLQHIARYNDTTTSVTLETFSAMSGDDSSTGSLSSNKPILAAGAWRATATFSEKFKMELERYKLLFKNATIARLTILIWIIYIFDYWGFSIAGALLPYILKHKSEEAGLSTESTYRSYIYIYLFGIPGVLLGTSLYKGRQLAMLGSSAMMGASLFIFAAVNTQAKYIGTSGLEYFFQSMFNAVLYGWTPEAYPAPIRGTAAGVASFWGRIASIVGPIAGQNLLGTSYDAPLYLAGAGVFISTICIGFLPRKYLGAESF